MKIKEGWYEELLIEHGYEITKKFVDLKHFGNELVELSSSNMCIRYVVDRSEINIEVSSQVDSERWYDLDIVRAHLKGDKNLIVRHSFEELKDYLMDNHAIIQTLFLGENYIKTKESLSRLQQLRAEQLFKT